MNYNNSKSYIKNNKYINYILIQISVCVCIIDNKKYKLH